MKEQNKNSMKEQIEEILSRMVNGEDEPEQTIDSLWALFNVVGQSEQLVCPECRSGDLKATIHTDYKECNKCYHYWEAN